MTQYVMPDSSDHPVESEYVAYKLANECYEKNSDNHSFLLSEMLRSETRDQTIKRNSNWMLSAPATPPCLRRIAANQTLFISLCLVLDVELVSLVFHSFYLDPKFLSNFEVVGPNSFLQLSP